MENAALVVIDVQIGAFDGKAMAPIHSGDDLLDRASRLIAAARAAKLPVIFVQHCANEGQLLMKGSQAWELHPKIQINPNEPIVYKRQSSAFNDTGLHKMLQQLNVDTIISCGIQSEHCVSNTSIAALDLGMNVIVAGDAHSTLSTDDDTAETIIARQNKVLADRGAAVQGTAEILEHLSA
jgi:nicotinamidase-related amidase